MTRRRHSLYPLHGFGLTWQYITAQTFTLYTGMHFFVGLRLHFWQRKRNWKKVFDNDHVR